MHRHTEAPLEFLILDLTPSSHIDSSGCHTIGTELALRLRKKGIQVGTGWAACASARAGMHDARSPAWLTACRRHA